MPNLQTIVAQYLKTAAWADGDELESSEFSTFAKDLAFRDCAKFVEQAGNLLEGWDDEQIGHDFWLTRNGHGAGFWDRNLPNADVLTEVGKSFPSLSLYDDGNEEIQFN